MGKLEGVRIHISVKGENLTVLKAGQYGGSGSYEALDSDQLDELITLLTVHRMNHFQGRISSKPDRRQETRRRDQKTEERLKSVMSCQLCGRRPGVYAGWCNECRSDHDL